MQDFTFQINYDEASYTVMSYAGDEADVVIPGQYAGKPVTILFDHLFAGHKELRSVTFPDTITDLGEFLFDGCESLRHIELPPALENLWGYTFVRCGLEEITLPDTVSTIPPYAFKECRNLTRVVCGKGMKKIHAWAFGGCDKLTDLVCGKNVDVSPDAFKLNERILRLSYQ